MSHKRSVLLKSPFRTREAGPSMTMTKDGARILCPFCKPPHVIFPGQPTPCGTTLKLTAIQDILPSRIVRMQHILCLKCHQGGGEMVQYMNGFVHLIDCDPKTRLLPEIPAFNLLAGVVFHLPEGVRTVIEKVAGHAQAVEEIDVAGNKTGKVLGYFFMKMQPQGATNG